MADRKTFDRRFFNEAFAGGLLGLGIKRVLGSGGWVEIEEPPTKILTTNIDLANLSNADRNLVEYINNLPEGRVPFWGRLDVPYTFRSSKLDIFENLQRVVGRIIIDEAEKVKFEYETPDSGMATPADPQFPRVFVYGHSRWHGVEQISYRIQTLEVGDIVSVTNSRSIIPYCFVVDNLRLSSEEFVRTPSELGLILQITAMEKGKWILDKDSILQKADASTFDNWHANFCVDAKPLRIRVPV